MPATGPAQASIKGSGHLSPIIRPMRLVGAWRRQWWQPIRRPRIVAAGVMHTPLPRCFEFAARAGAVGVNGTSDFFADLAFKADAAAGLGISADHGNAGGVDLYHQVVRHNAPGRLAFAPEERHTEVPAAGAAVKARVIFRHDATEGRLLLSGLARGAILNRTRGGWIEGTCKKICH